MARVVLVLYPDPGSGYPSVYARESIPTQHGYPGGQTLPSPSSIDFKAGELRGCASGKLGLRKFLEAGGHQVTPAQAAPDPTYA